MVVGGGGRKKDRGFKSLLTVCEDCALAIRRTSFPHVSSGNPLDARPRYLHSGVTAFGHDGLSRVVPFQSATFESPWWKEAGLDARVQLSYIFSRSSVYAKICYHDAMLLSRAGVCGPAIDHGVCWRPASSLKLRGSGGQHKRPD